MTRKIAVKYKDINYDPNIVDALLRLKSPIIGINETQFYIRDKARKENGLEHIANRKHQLKVRDIEIIPSILKKPKLVEIDSLNKNYKNYYGLRKGDNATQKFKYLKIVTDKMEKKKNKEFIITIYAVNTIPVVSVNK